MASLNPPAVALPASGRPDGLSPLDRRRIRDLGFGSRVDRRRLRHVCGTASAANQWLDKASKEGVLVPVGWGEYQVVEERVLGTAQRADRRAHRRLISWALTLPDALHPDVTFLAPRVWKETALPWDRPAPVVPFDGTAERAPAPLGALGYSVQASEPWQCLVGESDAVPVAVPSRLDSVILLGANVDPDWQIAAAQMAAPLSSPERRFVRRQLHRLHRFPLSRSSSDGGPAPGLGTPGWWNEVHDRAVEGLVKDAYTI